MGEDFCCLFADLCGGVIGIFPCNMEVSDIAGVISDNSRSSLVSNLEFEKGLKSSWIASSLTVNGQDFGILIIFFDSLKWVTQPRRPTILVNVV